MIQYESTTPDFFPTDLIIIFCLSLLSVITLKGCREINAMWVEIKLSYCGTNTNDKVRRSGMKRGNERKEHLYLRDSKVMDSDQSSPDRLLIERYLSAAGGGTGRRKTQEEMDISQEKGEKMNM